MILHLKFRRRTHVERLAVRRGKEGSVFIWAAAARGSASFRSADAAQVCSNVGLLAVDGAFECSFTTAARQIVSERW